MAKEAIEEIKRAEESAKQIIGDAEEKAAQLIKNASEQAYRSEQALKEALKSEYNAAVAEAEKKAESISVSSERNSKEKAEAEKKRIFERKSNAIKMVREAILQP